MEREKVSASGDSVKASVSNKIQMDFRNMDAEYTLMAYFVRKNPEAAKQANKAWFSDVCLRGIYEVVADTRAILKPKILYEELRQRRIIRNGDGALYDPVIRDLWGRNMETVDEKAAAVMLTQVMRLSRSRQILERAGKIVLDMEHFDLDAAQAILKELSVPIAINDDHGGQYLDNYAKRLDILEARKEQSKDNEEGQVGVLTGIDIFDQWTGGLLPGEFGVLAGTSNIGKTAAIVGFGLTAWLAGRDVLIVSGEMSRDDLEFRIDSNLAKIDATKFRKAELDEADYARWDRSIKDNRAMHDNVLWVAAFTRKFDCDVIRAEMQRMYEVTGRKPKVIVADYLGIMSPCSGGRDNSNGWKEQGDVVWDIKELTEENQIVLWTANQVTDAAYGKQLFDLTDLKYARSIGFTAPVVLALIQDSEDLKSAQMKLQVLKMRNSKFDKRPIRLTPHMDFMMIDDPLMKPVTSLTEGEGALLNVVPRSRFPRRNGRMDEEL